ncbi:MAG TPA: hypothetical protein VJQ82_04775 [Terriglobales bacterium]|nr:hypothetical protein [Terriglobales bacterium]
MTDLQLFRCIESQLTTICDWYAARLTRTGSLWLLEHEALPIDVVTALGRLDDSLAGWPPVPNYPEQISRLFDLAAALPDWAESVIGLAPQPLPATPAAESPGLWGNCAGALQPILHNLILLPMVVSLSEFDALIRSLPSAQEPPASSGTF